MFDGLKDILIDFFKWAIDPVIEAFKFLVCWFIQLLVSFASAVMSLALSVFPSYPVPGMLRSGLSSVETVLDVLNWPFPLGLVGGLMLATFFLFVAYFLFVPFYRAVMDLL